MSGVARAWWFALPERGVLEVTGADRVRWLDGMLTNDVAAAASAPGGGCPALLLTRQGRIVAHAQLLAFPDRIWLEIARVAIAPARAALEKLLVADEVELADESGAWLRIALEGPDAPAVLSAACGGAPQLANLAPGHHVEVTIPEVETAPAGLADGACVVAHFAFGAEPGRQLFVPRSSASAVETALSAAGAQAGDAALFQRRRVEAGTPLQGLELDESVLPDEARLGDAVSTTKGCYIGQEVVARLRSRDRVGHLLVGLRLAAPAEPGAEIRLGERKLGEVTSAAVSPRFGAIALGFVPSAQALPGTALEVGGAGARVSALPFPDADADADASDVSQTGAGRAEPGA